MNTTQLNIKANIPADITFLNDMITLIITTMTTTTMMLTIRTINRYRILLL